MKKEHSELCFGPEPLFGLIIIMFWGVLNFSAHFWPLFTNMWGSLETRDLGLPGSDMCLSEQPPVRVSTGQYFWLEPKNAFDNFQEPDIGLIALAFLQGSFAYGGWNFLNYVTEELVDPHK